MTRKNDRYPKLDKSLLSDGTKIQGSENWTTSPRDWEGYLDRRGKDIVWELEGVGIPELREVIKAKGVYNVNLNDREEISRGKIPNN